MAMILVHICQINMSYLTFYCTYMGKNMVTWGFLAASTLTMDSSAKSFSCAKLRGKEKWPSYQKKKRGVIPISQIDF